MRSKRVRGSTTNVLCGGLADSDMFTAIDPGVSYFGWALMDAKRRCVVVAGLATTYTTGAHALIERPVYRPGSLADPRDVVDLAFTAGLVAGHYGAVSWVEPNDWKGTVDGVVFLNRARRELKRKWSADAGVIDAALAKLPKKMHEHVLDAYALGMWGLGESLL
jgi:hypothetical protein